MDYDYEVDYSQSDKMLAKREQVLDMNYPEQAMMLFYSRENDSLNDTALYEEMRNLNKTLLTNNVNDIKIFVNESTQFKLHSDRQITRDN